MQSIEHLPPETSRRLLGVFCDIDDTLTWKGKLIPAALVGLDRLRRAGLRVVPVTGRPGGWVDQIARLWPVDGVVGENGGLWFYLSDGKMHRRFLQTEEERRRHRITLDALSARILERVPGAGIASDQPYRELDLAIDFCEDVPPLRAEDIDTIVDEFVRAGARAKVSSIHVNGWFGHFDKLTGCREFIRDRFDETLDDTSDRYVFVGDSANDEPMFEFFDHSIGVDNVRAFLPRMQVHPRYVTHSPGGHGFAELVDVLLEGRGAAD